MHFLVIVVGGDVDQQLEPFQEGGRDTCPEEYLEFWDEEGASREHYLTGIFDSPLAKRDYPEHFGKPIREVFPSFDDYMLAVHGERDGLTGRYGDWYNPHGQYDWYVLGGRFFGHLVLKPGWRGPADHLYGDDELACPLRTGEAVKGDIDFEAMSRECYEEFVAAWDELERAGKTADRSAKDAHDIPETITNREQLLGYARRRAAHNAPAAVVVGGEWFGPWWVPDGKTEDAAEQWDRWYSSLLASLPDDGLLTVVDCHTVCV
jgi:hypothetical protein